MKYYQCKTFWVLAAIFSSVLLMAGYYRFKIMTSTYKTDFGNGVVIYADDYVKTGLWVFDCKYSRLVRRTPLDTPFAELENTGKITIENSRLNPADEQPGKEALIAITSIRGWHKNLRHLYSPLNENSNLNSHVFYLTGEHAGRSWAIEVTQSINHSGKSKFTAIVEPYDPETYTDYAKALEDAANSCPIRQ